MTPARLIAWRKKTGNSQSQLASALSVDVTTISRWERRVREIPPFLHLALECLALKGGELGKGARYNKPGRYPVQEERMIVAKNKILRYPARATETKKKMKRGI
jgi:transcriptional regulator with XRE-family HTH domain